MKARPAQRTLEWLRRNGAMPGMTERWNQHVGKFGIRQDLWGLIDIIAIWPDRTDFIQVCGTDVFSHIKKIQSSVELQERLDNILDGWPKRRFFLIAWRKRQLKKQNRPQWIIRVIEFVRDGNCITTNEILPEVYLMKYFRKFI